jgi:hypothetical protein
MSGLGMGLPVINDWLAGQIAALEDLALTKTAAWNTAADGVRPLRPEDVGLTEHTTGFAVQPGAYTILSSYAVPSGMGILFAGWLCDGDLGYNSYLMIQINGVKRQEIAGHVPYDQASKVVFTLEQICYAKQNDKIIFTAYNSGVTTVSCTVWPIAFIAGEKKTLLIE